LTDSPTTTRLSLKGWSAECKRLRDEIRQLRAVIEHYVIEIRTLKAALYMARARPMARGMARKGCI